MVRLTDICPVSQIRYFLQDRYCSWKRFDSPNSLIRSAITSNIAINYFRKCREGCLIYYQLIYLPYLRQKSSRSKANLLSHPCNQQIAQPMTMKRRWQEVSCGIAVRIFRNVHLVGISKNSSSKTDFWGRRGSSISSKSTKIKKKINLP